MTREEFIKKFCPDHENKAKELKRMAEELCQEGLLVERELYLVDNISKLKESMFSDALDNLIDKVCAIQKGYCSDAVEDTDVWRVLYAREPKIEDL